MYKDNQKLEAQLIQRVYLIKTNIKKLNQQKNTTNYMFEKKEITNKIQALEFQLKEIEEFLINKVKSKKVINTKIESYKKDIKEIEYILETKQMSEKDYTDLFNKKLDLNLFISEVNWNKECFPKKPLIYNESKSNFRKEELSKAQHTSMCSHDYLINDESLSSKNVYENYSQPVVQQIIKEVPVEIIKEVIKEVPVEIVKEVPIEIIKELPGKTIIKEVIKEVPVEIIKEVEVPPYLYEK